MTPHPIGRLQRIPLREVWRHEASNFTQWLQNNIDVLNEALDVTLLNVKREAAAGDFSVDLVAEDEVGEKVIIENQLERSDHDHLGKLITYLTAMNARRAVWIVSDPRPEHVAAVSWLNDNSTAAFHLVKVEAVQIGDSAPAALFTAIVEPPEAKTDIARSNKDFAARHAERLAWWTELLTRPDARLHAHLRPTTDTWIRLAAGKRGLSFIYGVNTEECYAELYIDRGAGSDAANKAVFDFLHARRDVIERAFGGPLTWDRQDAKRGSRIRVTVEGGYRSPSEEWESIQATLVGAMSRLHEVLQPQIVGLEAPQS